MSLAAGMDDSLTEEGLWWLEGSDDQVSGTLTYDPVAGPELRLLGMLRDLESSLDGILGADGREATIFGVTRRGRPVTLLRAMNVSRQINFPGLANETWRTNLLVFGHHLSSADDEVFSKSYLRFRNVEQWLRQSPFQEKHEWQEDRLTVVASRPRESAFASHRDFEITSTGSLSYNNDPETRFTVDVVSHLGVVPPEPRSLNWHFAKAVRLQELASLCTGHYLPLTALELIGPERDLVGGGRHAAEVEVYARLVHPEAGSRPNHELPVVSGPELMKYNPEAVQLWFDQYEVLSPAIGLFFTISGQRQMFTNVRFLLAIQALEVFHRRTSDDAVLPEDEFRAFADRLIAAIPEDATSRMREKLRGTYTYLNEPSLGQRLKAIVKDLADAFGAAPPAFDKRYLRSLVDTRNYYTHFSAELEDRKLDGGGMHWASRRIVLLLTILFLRRLGVGAADLERLFDRHQEFSRLWTTADDPF